MRRRCWRRCRQRSRGGEAASGGGRDQHRRVRGAGERARRLWWVLGSELQSPQSSTSIRHQHRQPAQAAMPAVASLPAPPPAARRPRFSPVASASLRRVASGGGSSWRSERRLMSELEHTVTAGAAERVIRSYVGTKSERAALAALSRLLMDSDPLAIPFYEAVTQARWYKWSSIHAAAVAALLEVNGKTGESRSLISNSISEHLHSTNEGSVREL